MDMKAPHLNEIKPTSEFLNLIGEIDEFKGRWAATLMLAPDRLAALKQVATIESVGSSTRIEGAKLTNSEIESLLRGVKNYSFRSRDEQEVAGYAELMELIFTSFREFSFTENHIKQLHNVLLKYSTKDERHHGDYKKFANSVEAFGPDGKSKGVIFHTATPFETPALMKDLLEWITTQKADKKLHPLIIVSVFVVVFLHIHPFQDGNGRLSRVLTTLILMQLGYNYVAYSSFERIIEENKDAYYLALRRGQSGHLNDWILFFLKSMKKQKLTLEDKMAQELVFAKMPPLSVQLIELIKNHGPTSIAKAVAATGANRNTVKAHFKNLVANGYLVIDGAGRASKYRQRV